MHVKGRQIHFMSSAIIIRCLYNYKYKAKDVFLSHGAALSGFLREMLPFARAKFRLPTNSWQNWCFHNLYVQMHWPQQQMPHEHNKLDSFSAILFD